MLSKAEAKKAGKRAGHAAATWFTPDDRTLEMFDDGDPELDDYLPRRPDLSGEHAGESINEILAVEADDDPDDVDEIANVWQEAADEAFDAEIARAFAEFSR